VIGGLAYPAWKEGVLLYENAWAGPVGLGRAMAREGWRGSFSLVGHQVEFGKTHNLGELLRRAESIATGIARRLAAAVELTPYAVEERYLGAIAPLDTIGRARRSGGALFIPAGRDQCRSLWS